jgi:4-amino-4-deoxy-L-arabinose transferase-like glycosyltransferase
MGSERTEKSFNWMMLSGVAIGLAILGKGLPAVFAIVFLVGLAAVERDEQILLRWLLSGAPLIAAAIGVPWFAYVGSTVGLRTIQDEAEIAARGMEHTGSAFQYIPQTMLAVAPWTAIALLALVLAVREMARGQTSSRHSWCGSARCSCRCVSADRSSFTTSFPRCRRSRC